MTIFNPDQKCTDCGKHLPNIKIKRCLQCFRNSQTPVKRFWKYVNKTPTCWLWTGCDSGQGYGLLGSSTLAHRFSYELHKGKIKDGLCVCHKCDIRKCVNPEHLFVGNRADNNHDCVTKNRNAKGKMLPQTKLTKEDVVKIRSLYVPWNYPCTRLAKEFGTHYRNIWCIVKRKSWNHVS